MEKVADEGYSNILKVHTKKSKHRKDGNLWRDDLFSKLINESSMNLALKIFKSEPDVGVIGPHGHVIPMNEYFGSNAQTITSLSLRLGLDLEKIKPLKFVAGSMFFARVSALNPLLNLAINELDFEVEAGQVDGTFAHAIERIIAVSCNASGYKLIDLKSEGICN
jgi:lipopolysaccharide biosynthesis protein